jgi:serine/threonine protein kinase
VIRPDLTARPGLVERFRREVTAAAKLTHPNIVTAYDAEQAGDTFFLVMEFVEGTDLARYLKQHGPLSVSETCNYVRQTASGLRHAHEHHMIHRDLKPHNLMRTPAGQIKILDFGLARIANAAVGDETSRGTVVGTADYMAPEQANDAHAADIRADIYSLGCTFYQLLSGRVPFPGGGLLDKCRRHAEEQPTPLTQLRPEVPGGLGAVVAKMMAKDVGERYQTSAEVEAALEPWCQPQPETVYRARPSPPPGSPFRLSPVLAIAALTALALVAALLAVLGWRSPESPEDRQGDVTGPRPTASPSLGGKQSGVPPEVSELKPEIDDDFSDPRRSQFPEKRAETFTKVFRDKRYVLSMIGSDPNPNPVRHLYSIPGITYYKSLACQVTARVKAPKGYGWAVYLANTPERIIAIMMHKDGSIEVGRAPWTKAAYSVATVGPIRCSSARPAEEFNTLLVIMRQGQALEVYVNGRSVRPPIRLAQALGPATTGIGLWQTRPPDGPLEARAEFSRFKVWQLAETGPPDEP